MYVPRADAQDVSRRSLRHPDRLDGDQYASYGYHKDITCEKCGYEFPVNVSPWAEPQDPRSPVPILKARCPNCDYSNDVKGVGAGTMFDPRVRNREPLP